MGVLDTMHLLVLGIYFLHSTSCTEDESASSPVLSLQVRSVTCGIANRSPVLSLSKATLPTMAMCSLATYVPPVLPATTFTLTCCEAIVCCATAINANPCCSATAANVWLKPTTGASFTPPAGGTKDAVTGTVTYTAVSSLPSNASPGGTPPTTCTTCAGTGVYTKPVPATGPTVGNPIPVDQGSSFTCCTNTACSDNSAPCCNTDVNNVYVTGASYGGENAQPGTGKAATAVGTNPFLNSLVGCTTTAYYSTSAIKAFATNTNLLTSAFTCCDTTSNLCCTIPSGDVCCRAAATAGSVFASGFTTVTGDYTMVKAGAKAATPTFNTCTATTVAPTPSPSPSPSPPPVTNLALPAAVTAALIAIAIVIIVFVGLPALAGGGEGLGRKKRSLKAKNNIGQHLDEATSAIKKMIEAAQEQYDNQVVEFRPEDHFQAYN